MTEVSEKVLREQMLVMGEVIQRELEQETKPRVYEDTQELEKHLADMEGGKITIHLLERDLAGKAATNFRIRLTVSSSDPCLNREDIPIKLELLNDSDQDFYISRDQIILDGFMNDKFRVTSVRDSDGQVPYVDKMVDYNPKSVFLRAHQSLFTELNLAGGYDFGSAYGGEYSVSFSTWLFLCKDAPDTNCISGGEKKDTVTIHVCPSKDPTDFHKQRLERAISECDLRFYKKGAYELRDKLALDAAIDSNCAVADKKKMIEQLLGTSFATVKCGSLLAVTLAAAIRDKELAQALSLDMNEQRRETVSLFGALYAGRCEAVQILAEKSISIETIRTEVLGGPDFHSDAVAQGAIDVAKKMLTTRFLCQSLASKPACLSKIRFESNSSEKQVVKILMDYVYEHLFTMKEVESTLVSFSIRSDQEDPSFPFIPSWPTKFAENKKYMPLIAAQMLHGDSRMFDAYRNLTKELVICPELCQDEDWSHVQDLAVEQEIMCGRLNGVIWLDSREAVQIFGPLEDGLSTLCQANQMLGLDSTFINCEDYIEGE